MKQKTEKKKPVPMKCICGNNAITVRVRGGKMISCSNPVKCSANIRTCWHSHEATAIEQWNAMITEQLYKRKGKEIT